MPDLFSHSFLFADKEILGKLLTPVRIMHLPSRETGNDADPHTGLRGPGTITRRG